MWYCSSPAANEILWLREVTPYLSYFGPAWFRRLLLHLVPIPTIQRLKNVTDVVAKRTEEIYYAKKAAIQSGDKELLHALGEAKDVMSVLCEYLATLYVLLSRRSYAHRGCDSAGEHEGIRRGQAS